MSSEFAEFLFSYACNKLETSPQLDLRQQLLHSNLIRHILLVHQQPTPTTPPTSSTSVSSDHPSPSHSHQGEQQQHPFPMEETPTAAAPSSPPSSSSSLVAPSPQSPSSSSSSSSVWSPFSFDDELDRIQLTDQHQQQLDSDVDMEEQDDESDQQPSSSSSTSSLSPGNTINSNAFDLSSSSSSSMIFDDSYYNYFYQSSPFQQQQQHHHYQHQHEQQQLLQLHQIQLQYPLQQHQQQMLDEDQEYLFEASQAQEDWLDAVLEDLIEDDQDNDDDDQDETVSSPEYDSDDSVAGEYDRDTFEDDVERQQRLSDPRHSFLSHHHHHRLLPFGPDNEKGSTLSFSATGTTTTQTTPSTTTTTTTTTSTTTTTTTTPPLTPCLSPSSPPPTSTQATNAHIPTPTTTTGTAAAAAAAAATSPTSASRFLARGDNLDHDPTHRPHNNNINSNASNHHVSRRLVDFDDAYYHPCPPCLGFHCSSPSRSSSSSSSSSSPPSSFRGEDSLREERFAQLTQELTSTYLFQQHQETEPMMVFEHEQASLSAAPPLLLKTLKDPLSFRTPSSTTTSSLSRLSLRSSPWLEPSLSGRD